MLQFFIPYFYGDFPLKIQIYSSSSDLSVQIIYFFLIQFLVDSMFLENVSISSSLSNLLAFIIIHTILFIFCNISAVSIFTSHFSFYLGSSLSLLLDNPGQRISFPGQFLSLFKESALDFIDFFIVLWTYLYISSLIFIIFFLLLTLDFVLF